MNTVSPWLVVAVFTAVVLGLSGGLYLSGTLDASTDDHFVTS